MSTTVVDGIRASCASTSVDLVKKTPVHVYVKGNNHITKREEKERKKKEKRSRYTTVEPCERQKNDREVLRLALPGTVLATVPSGAR